MIITLQTLIFFRESLLAAIDRLLRPYYKNFLPINGDGSNNEDEESEDHVFAEFDDAKGVVFYPPVYAQRYAAVSDCLMDERWCGKLEKVVDLGYHDMSFIKYLKGMPGVKNIIGVDIESIPLRCSSDLFAGEEYTHKRENPLQVTLYQGNAADPDYRLIGCDAVVAIEMIEHMLPHDLERLIHTVFGFIKPWIVVFTTPNSDFNRLFKALEENGLRRLDHFFEWTREQFHDWCSNIVSRYPQYTVTCKGIGPGPPGTSHYGCCSQLALFVSNDYHKQQDLNLNSLALVAKTSNSNNISDVVGSCPESSQYITENNIHCLPNNVESYAEFTSDPIQSCVTVLVSPSYSLNSIEYRDVMSQCNLDFEVGRNFLMFDDEMYFKVLVPRRNVINRVYEIEDVNNRLNCTTLQVKRFSKTTQNLMARNKIDSFVHTREVIDKIRHLTKMLNFNKDSINTVQENSTWCNINWGDNAPYWNQYYEVVKEYNYPFENKSEECRILDLISDEVNRLIDTQCDDEFSVHESKLEIPIEQLMGVVGHITDDVDRVKDLLEWNGYEVVDDVVIHSRLVLDSESVTTRDEDWHEDDTVSDWDSTEVHSNSMSDASTTIPDYHGRCLRRALDQKVRKLRSVLSADGDITSELDRVVCRLMKLSLRTSRERQSPPPASWMLCKLLDLLTLTEKAIERRKKQFIDGCSLKTIDYDYLENQTKKLHALKKIKGDNNSVNEIMDKYRHFVDSIEDRNELKENGYNCVNVDLDNEVTVTNNDIFKDFTELELIDETTHLPSIINIESLADSAIYNRNIDLFVNSNRIETTFLRTQAWVVDDVEVVSYPDHDNVAIVSSGDADKCRSNLVQYALKKSFKRHKMSNVKQNYKLNTKLHNKGYKKFKKIYKMNEDAKKESRNKSKISKIKKAAMIISNHNILNKTCANEISSTVIGGIKSTRKILKYSNPIPENLIELCQSRNSTKKNITDLTYKTIDDRSISPKITNEINVSETVDENTNILAAEGSLRTEFIMDCKVETIALHRTISTDLDILDKDTIIGVSDNIMKEDRYCYKPEIPTENIDSRTVFLNDINEPSTSKGVRHVSMDAQCGPDISTFVHSLSSKATSFTMLPNIFNSEIKIGDSLTCIKTQMNSDSSNWTNDNCRTMTPSTKSVGIKIKKSDSFIYEKVECATMTNDMAIDNIVCTETNMIKIIPSVSKLEQSKSEFCGSVNVLSKTPLVCPNSSNDTSEIHIKSSVPKEIIGPYKCLSTKHRPKLSCGSVYIHSYKDKQLSEDIVYQGQWQCYRPKTIVRRRTICNTVAVKKVGEGLKTVKKVNVKSKDNIQINTNDRKIVNRLYVHNSKQNKTEKELRNNKLPDFVSAMKCDKNIVKAVPKEIIRNKCDCSKSIKQKSKLTEKRPTVNKEFESMLKNAKNGFTPLYLKRNINTQKKQYKIGTLSTLNPSIHSVNQILKVKNACNIYKPIGHVPLFARHKTEDIKKDLLKYSCIPREKNKYIVLYNEIDNKNTEYQSPTCTKESIVKIVSGSRSTHSPESLNSSNNSSPNSVATVRAAETYAKTFTSKMHTVSNNRSQICLESDSTRNNKYSRKVTIGKKIEENDNKENISESSTKYEISSKVNIVERNKNIYNAQFNSDKIALKNEINSLSNLNIQVPKKSNLITRKSEVSRHTPLVLSKSFNNNIDKAIVNNISNGLSNHEAISNTDFVSSTINISETHFNVTDRDSSEKICTGSNSIFSDIKKLIESIDYDINYKNTLDNYDSKTVILSRDDNTNLDECISPMSFNTNEELSNSLQCDFDWNINQTFDSTLGEASIISVDDIAITATDTDLLSFKSITSESKMSEYYLADSEFITRRSNVSNECSVRDIFERKEYIVNQNPPETVALQTFSSFSVNAGLVVVDERSDCVDLLARQATSEEAFISGRSSGSNEPCGTDEDAVFPYWLFSQHSLDEVETEQLQPQPPMAVPVPMLDPNGNLFGVGGAGDGRGMHSDLDNSGQGTSLSSNDTSSRGQSETIVTDPSAFTAQFELLQDSLDNALVVPSVTISSEDVPNTFVIVGEEYQSNEFGSHVCGNPLGTDVIDFSDN